MTSTALFSLDVAGEGRCESVARILTVDPERTRGLRKLLFWVDKRQYGVIPGISKIGAQDLNLAIPTGWLYNYLHMRKSSPLSWLQREMLATVVNGLVGGPPDWACIRRPCVA